MPVDGRRLARALTLTTLAFLLFGGLTGVAFAQTEAGEALAVPVPRPGDSATYEVRMGFDDAVGLGGPGDLDVQRVRYEWLPQQWVTDADSDVHLAAPLRVTYEFNVGTTAHAAYDITAYFDTTTRQAIARSYDEHTETVAQGVSLGVGGPMRPFPIPGSVTDSHIVLYQGDLGTCGVWTPIHGLADGRVPFTDANPCGWPDAAGDPLPGRFQPVGWVDTRPWKGGPRSHSVYFDDADRDGGMQLGLWYDGKGPFPVRMRHTLAEWASPNEWTLGRVYLMERIGHGSAPAGAVYEVAAEAAGLGRVPTVPASTPWLVDDSALGWEFPLSRAHAEALAEPAGMQPITGGPTVGQWMATRPDAYLAFAVTINVEDGSGTPRPEWIMIWADGTARGDWIAKRVSWSSEAIAGIVVPHTGARRVQVEDWNPTWLPEDTSSYFPQRSLVPQAAADLGAVLQRYHDLAGADAPFDRYGVQVYCRATCQDAVITVEAGHVVVPQDGDANVLHPASTALDKLVVDDGGRLMYRAIVVGSRDGVLPGPTEPPRAYSGATTPMLAGVWIAPPAGAATGVGLLAVLAGALYYFWPVVKGTAFGLFSRTRDDELLQNPRRALIAQLVEANPGIHFHDIARRLGIGRGALEHHLRKMVAADLLSKVATNGYTCYFPKGQVDRRVMAAAPLLRSAGRMVLEQVRQNPGASGRQIAARLGLSQSTVSYHLRRLEEAGLVFGSGDGAGARLSPLGEQAAA